MKRWIVMVSAAAALLLCAACGPAGRGGAVDVDDPAAIHERYIRPLGLTTVIGQPWSGPEELDADSVLVTYEIRILEDEELLRQYLDEENGNLILPPDAVEDYTAEVFGMSAAQTRACRDYDGENYVIPVGLGGAWDVQTTGASLENGILYVEYELIDAQGEVAAFGEMAVQTMADSTHRYLSNRQWGGQE